MVCVKVLVLVVLGSVAGPVLVGGAEIGRSDLRGFLEKPSESLRLDSDEDPTSNVVVAPSVSQSALFGECQKAAGSAIVRFNQINLESGGQYTRYVPSDAQRSMYDPAWVKVTCRPINSLLECSSFADQKSAMMFKYDGSICSLSPLRLSTSSPKCGDRTAEAYFVRTSCPEPSVTSVSVTQGDTGLEVSWTADDACDLATNYRVEWNGGNDDTSDSTARDFTITEFEACQMVSVTVVALDIAGAPFGQSQTDSVTAASAPPEVSNITVRATGIVTYEVTWDLYDPCSQTDSFGVVFEVDFTAEIGTASADGDARMVTTALNDCPDVVTVKVYDINSNEIEDESTGPIDSLYSAQCNNLFFPTCSGCLYQSTASKPFADAVTECHNLVPASKHLTVANGDEFDDLRDFLDDYFGTGSEARFWVNLHKRNSGDWVWTTEYVQPLPAANPNDWVSGQPNGGGGLSQACAFMMRGKDYKLGDLQCDGGNGVAYAMCFYN